MKQPILLRRIIKIDRLHELIDEGISTATTDKINHYDGGMNFLGVLENPAVQGDVELYCTWNYDVSIPIRWEASGKNHKPNVLCDYNGSGEHFPNSDPRYLLPIGSTGLLLNKIVFLNDDKEVEFWSSRCSFIQNLQTSFKTQKEKMEWAKQQTEFLNESLRKKPKEITVKARSY